MSVRDQYAGDVSDYLKFAFLRALAQSDRRLGVAWYYAPGNDGRPDGRHTEWQDDPAWVGLDKALHSGLRVLPVRSVAALQEASIWPQGTLFHREPVPPRASRSSWAAQKRAALTGADIVFLDPDNGLGKETSKHAAWPELHALRHPGRALVFIAFPGRSKPHAVLLQELHDRLIGEIGTNDVATLCTNVSVPRAEGSKSLVQRQRWFTLVDPDDILLARAQAFSEVMSALPRVTGRLVVRRIR